MDNNALLPSRLNMLKIRKGEIEGEDDQQSENHSLFLYTNQNKTSFLLQHYIITIIYFITKLIYNPQIP